MGCTSLPSGRMIEPDPNCLLDPAHRCLGDGLVLLLFSGHEDLRHSPIHDACRANRADLHGALSDWSACRTRTSGDRTLAGRGYGATMNIDE